MASMSVAEFYKDRCIFITGGTGFLGKVLVEKLLRSCPELRRLYLLIRPKKGVDIQQRLNDMLDIKLFERVKLEQPGYKNKVMAIPGDMMDDDLGICRTDLDLLTETVSVVFHSAATIKFDEEIKLSVQLNVIGVCKLIQLAHQMKKLEAFVHVSTAYANCDKSKITETVYPPPLHPHKLIEAVGWMDPTVLKKLTPKLIGSRPNTYTYTKSMAEYVITEEGGDLPIAIVRPSIIGASLLDPVPGWIDNINGPSGLLAAIGKGVLRSMHGDFNATADLIPVDLSANLLIVVAWYTALERPDRHLVYNCTTGSINKYTWGQIERAAHECFIKNPVDEVLRIPNPRFTANRLWYKLNLIFDHFLPAHLMDIYMRLIGRKPIFVKVQDRLQSAVSSLDYFTFRQWEFVNDNMFVVLNKLPVEDKKVFNYDPKIIVWPKYIENYCLGIKQFILKEELSQLPKARRALQRLKYVNYVFNAFLVIIVWRILIGRVSVAKSLWNFVMSWVLAIFRRLPKFIKSS